LFQYDSLSEAVEALIQDYAAQSARHFHVQQDASRCERLGLVEVAHRRADQRPLVSA
jgi:hypothetical protein